MNPMQQMIMEAQRVNRELAKARAELAKREFTINKAGLVTVVMLGDRTVKEVKIEKSALEPDSQELLQETIALAINDGLAQIETANEDINEKITGNRNL
jgi:nucleoid-associated protein EbfC